ncbi:MAG TPA: hypothetical protein VFZ74_15440, partial [Burkholderiales bacterium]
ADRMGYRNRAVLLAHGRQEIETRIGREFERIGALVTHELQDYPTLQRKLLDARLRRAPRRRDRRANRSRRRSRRIPGRRGRAKRNRPG